MAILPFCLRDGAGEFALRREYRGHPKATQAEGGASADPIIWDLTRFAVPASAMSS